MSYSTSPGPVDPANSASQTTTTLARTRFLWDVTVATAIVVLALLALYAVYFDQGALLSSSLGDISWSANFAHEFFHDGRHLVGIPCH